MSTPPVDMNPAASQPPVGSSGQPVDNNSLGFDPGYDSTFTFDATQQPEKGFDPSAYPGSDAVTQMLDILSQISDHPENTTDAQLFLLYTSGLVQSGMIYQPLTAPDGSTTTLDALIASITVTKADGSQESLIACAIDVAVEEKYAQEVAAGNSDWDPNDGFFDYLHSLFPPDGYDENGDPIYNSQVSQEANDEIDSWEGPDGKWYSYQTENEGKSADELRADTSKEWDYDVTHSNIDDVETELRVDTVHTASNGGTNLEQSLMLLYGILEMLGMGDMLNLTGQVDWYNDRTNDLNNIEDEWDAGFDTPEDAYNFVTDVNDFVDEINNAPDGYADQNLIDTVNQSLGMDGGFLDLPTGFYYYDSNTNTYQQANVEYLYDHSDDGTVFYNGDTDSGYCDANGNEYTYSDIQTMPPDTKLYVNNGTTIVPDTQYGTTGTLKSNIHDPNETSDYYTVNNQPPLTWGQIAVLPPSTELNYSTSGSIFKPNAATAGDLQQNMILTEPPASGTVQPGVTVMSSEDGETALYDTLNGWELDPTGMNPPPPQFETTQQEINTDITAITNTASSTSNAVDQMSNWIQAVQSAMASSIDTFNQGITTFVDNDIVA